MNSPLSKSRTSYEWAEIFLGAAVALGAAAGLAKVVMQLTPPFQMDYGEGHLIALATRVARGASAYPDPSQPPYVMNPYGPVGVWLVAACLKFFGVAFTLPRVLVMICGLWCAVIILLLVRQWGRNAPVAILSGLLYLSRPVVQDWLPRLRVDLIGLAFALTGLYLFARSRRWYLSIPFFVAAVLCKMTLVAGPAACLIYTVLRGEGKRAIRFGVSFVALGMVIFLWAQHVSHGWFAFHTLWLNASQPFSWQSTFWYLRTEMGRSYWLIAVAIAVVYYARSHTVVWLPLLFLVVATLSLLTVGKLGGNFNYFVEWEAALCLCAGMGYAHLREQMRSRHVSFAILPAALAILAFSGVHLRHVKPNLKSNFSECREVYGLVNTYPAGPILSENVGALILAGKQPIVLDPFIWTRGVLNWGVPDSEVVQLLRSRRIALIILGSDVSSPKKDSENPRWPPAVLSAIEENYRPTNRFNCMDARFTYQPQVSQPAP